jgi:hypothetical protein
VEVEAAEKSVVAVAVVVAEVVAVAVLQRKYRQPLLAQQKL